MRMALSGLVTGPTESHPVKQNASVSYLGGFPDYHTGTVVDKETAADFRSRMDFHPCPETCQHTDQAGDYRDTEPVQPVGDTVHHDCVPGSIAEQGFQPVPCRWIVFLYRFKILDNLLYHS